MAIQKYKTYLLRDIPPKLWGEVKSSVFNENLTIKDWLLEAIRNELRRKADGKKGN